MPRRRRRIGTAGALPALGAANLPAPGRIGQGPFSLEVWQAWWGYPMKKATWLCFFGVEYADIPPMPFRLHGQGADRRRQQLMSKNQRAATHPDFAAWLVDAARKTHNARDQVPGDRAAGERSPALRCSASADGGKE